MEEITLDREVIPNREVVSDGEVTLDSEVALNDPAYEQPGVDVEMDTGFAQCFDDELQRDLLNIPDKMLFKIGEVASLAGIKPYILRYWESEFSSLRPKKAPNNQRMYNKKDFEIVFLIKKLLYRDRYSIQGAKKVLNGMKLELKNFNKWMKILKAQSDASEKLQKLLDDIQLVKQKHNNLQI